MIKIKINEDERLLKDIDEQWINQQINRRRGSGEDICVRVTIQQGNLNMILSTPSSQGGGGGSGRQPNPQERVVYDLWNKRGLDNNNFNGGNLIAFLKQYENLL